MQFFVPHAQTQEIAEDVYEATKACARDTLGWDVADRRIFIIASIHERRASSAEVGKVTDVNHEEVLVILASTTLLVCTPSRGVLKGQPMLVGRHEVTWIEDFDRGAIGIEELKNRGFSCCSCKEEVPHHLVSRSLGQDKMTEMALRCRQLDRVLLQKLVKLHQPLLLHRFEPGRAPDRLQRQVTPSVRPQKKKDRT